MTPYPDILVRAYSQINKDRRTFLEMAYQCFPDTVDCSITQLFNWESSEGRTAIFDLYYLESAGYIEIVAQGRKFGIPPTPYAYILTKAGIDILEKPGELDRLFPIIPFTHHSSTEGLNDSEILKEIINTLERLRSMVHDMEIPDSEKNGMLYYINALLAHPSLQRCTDTTDDL